MPRLAHVGFIFSGTLGPQLEPVEEWSFTVRTNGSSLIDTGGQAARDAIADGARAAYQANLPNILKNDCFLTRVEAVEWSATGAYSQTAGGEYERGVWAGTPVAGGFSASTIGYMPPQTALVATLDTPRVGPSGTGRIFLPFPGFTLGSDLRISAADAQLAANTIAEFVRDLNGIGPGLVSVMSSKGFGTVVNSVRVGRAADTLRSRRKSVLEGYAVTAV